MSDSGERALALRRRQMGESIQEMIVANGDGAIGDVGDGYWLALSGLPSPDVNVALVDSESPATRDATRARVEATGYPTVFMLAGPASSLDLGPRWRHLGAMPLMSCRLAALELAREERVRAATSADAGAVVELLASSYEMASDAAGAVTKVLDRGTAATTSIWLLVEEGRATSTVLTAVVDDAVCVWCMATPSRFRRRGYARALLGEVLARARDEGARLGLLGATPAGLPLYEACGWRPIDAWQVFVTAETAQFAG